MILVAQGPGAIAESTWRKSTGVWKTGRIGESEEIRDGEDVQVGGSYIISSEKKDQFHFAVFCPYDVKVVKVVLPYDKNRISEYHDNVAVGESFDEPSITHGRTYTKDAEKNGYKLLGWCTDEGMYDNMMVKEWPYTVTADTIFYAKTEKWQRRSC